MAVTTEGVESIPAQAKLNDNEYSALDALGIDIAKLRKEAIDGRRLQGIEDDWIEDEEFYQGIDDANRHESNTSKRIAKPVPIGQWSTATVQRPVEAPKASLFINITRPYVDAAAARFGDMILPTDDKCWGIKPTPIPDLDEAMKSEVLITLSSDMEVTEAEFAEAVQQVAKERAKAGERRIEDWFTEGKWNARCRQVIHDSARLGTGILKGPVPTSKRLVKWNYDPALRDGVKSVDERKVPESRRVDPFNFFPDPTCGEDIQDGSYVFERDYLTKKRVKELARQPGFIDKQVNACLQEGPVGPMVDWNPNEPIANTVDRRNHLYEIWYFYGVIEAEKLRNAGLVNMMPKGEDGYDKNLIDQKEIGDNELVSVEISMVNHRVVRAIVRPLDDGTFPYDMFVWQTRPGMCWGMGVARQIRSPQRQLNAANRAMLENAAKSSGPQVVIDTDCITPLNGVWEIVPNKLWKRVPGSSLVDVQKAFWVFNIDNQQERLQAMIELALRFAEESTGLPMILQGQMGEKDVDTLGGMRMLMNNASSVLRRLAKNWDDQITSRHVGRYYNWLMEYGENPNEKGDFIIEARGSSTLVERDIQNQELAFMLDVSANPIYGIDPKKIAEEYLRSRRMDPKNVQMDEDSMAAGPGGPDPKVMAAAIASEDANAQRQHESVENDKQRQHETQQQLIETNQQNQQFNAEQAENERQRQHDEEQAQQDRDAQKQALQIKERQQKQQQKQRAQQQKKPQKKPAKAGK